MAYFNTADILGRLRSGVYPNPFFDLFNHYIPPDLKLLFEWFEYVYLSNPLVAAVIQKFASYPITEPVFDHGDEEVVSVIQQELERVKWKELLFNAGVENFVYGNAFVIAYPRTVKYGICDICDNSSPIDNYKNFKLESWEKGTGRCPKCGNSTSLKLVDKSVDTDTPTFTLWNPKLISIKRHPLTGDCRYYSSIPDELRQGIQSNDVFMIINTPNEIIRALKSNKLIEFNPSSIFHFKRHSLSGRFQDWGLSALFPVLKHLMLVATYRKANEAIALDHILPLRIIFPQPVSANTDPATTINLAKWRKMMEAVIQDWRRDPNLILVSPVPVGETHIGGSGKVLDVSDLISQVTQEILAGLGVPQEFVFGGLTWSGSSVSLRMLENQMLNYVGQLNRLLQWIVDKICDYKELPSVKVRLRPFRMADDNARKQIVLSLASAGLLSKRTILSELGFDYDTERENMLSEMADTQPPGSIQPESPAQQETANEGVETDFNPVMPEPVE